MNTPNSSPNPNRLVIEKNPDEHWWCVTYPSGNTNNYGSLPTLFGAIEDFYHPKSDPKPE